MRPYYFIAATLVLGALIVFAMTRTRDDFQSPDNFPALESSVTPDDSTIATFGNGCFWCTEAIFQELKGVRSVTSGYTGGRVQNPTYEQIGRGDTGHAEAIRITFDPKVISYPELLEVF